MAQENTIEKKKNLSDLASECLILILQLRATTNYGAANTLKSHVLEMFERFESNARKVGIDNEKIKHAKFALVALLDETIISSEWSEKNEWLTEPLQIKLFDTFNAGEEFFTYMSELRQRSSANKDVLEIFYFNTLICLFDPIQYLTFLYDYIIFIFKIFIYIYDIFQSDGQT
ncbi:MAG TPA: DotU family type IV/VI secretion system protein, partial [Ignavibacteriaceae bacterium]|nr:DotU family type IV/VI secretion system protein [Ignavibacteriaceae bacterium]